MNAKKRNNQEINRRKNPIIKNITIKHLILIANYLKLDFNFASDKYFDDLTQSKIEFIIHEIIHGILLNITLQKYYREIITEKLGFPGWKNDTLSKVHEILTLSLEENVIYELNLMKYFDGLNFNSCIMEMAEDQGLKEKLISFQNSKKGKEFIENYSLKISYEVYNLLQKLER